MNKRMRERKDRHEERGNQLSTNSNCYSRRKRKKEWGAMWEKKNHQI